MTPETETPTKTLEQLRAEYDAAKAEAAKLQAGYAPLYDDLQREIDQLNQAFNEKHSLIITLVQNANVAASDADDALRRAILAEYDARVKADPKASKTLGHGCSVRVTEKLQYEDVSAVTWAETNAPYMIKRSVDAKAFAAAMESMDKMPAFVVRKETVTAVVKG